MKKINSSDDNSSSILAPYELKSHLTEFTQQLTEQGYTPLSINGYINSISHFGTWLNKRGVLLKEINSEIFQKFTEHRCYCTKNGRRTHTLSKKYISRVQKFITFLHQQGVLQDQFEIINSPLPLLLLKFKESLQLRGLSERTSYRYIHSVNIILPLLGNDPKNYNATLIKQTILKLSKQYSPGGLKSITTSLRNYLRFLVTEELCTPDLDTVVPSVASWSLSSMPKYLNAKELKKIIDSCDTSTSKGIRDKAIILLLSRIGLRAGDIINMKLEDINWHNGTLHLFGKGHREDCLPLPQDAGDATLDYINKVRPLLDRPEVFFCINAPYRPLNTSGAVSAIVAKAITRSGINPPKYCGAHILRHTAATQMLRSGATLEAISSILRHQTLDMTGYYAKVDIPMLEKIVQPWPED